VFQQKLSCLDLDFYSENKHQFLVRNCKIKLGLSSNTQEYNHEVYASVYPCCSTEMTNFDGSNSDRRMFLIPVKQLRMNSNILYVKFDLAL
jgi:hypothetical protein